ncbi:AraC-like ligand-binding domain-containing protein [Kitasatospora griseola]|uniref:AraC-like ligand-binding domain-containing protein n=1 Tax=Kitasatospora griseola TaxID=2064 RepID=UPI00382BA2A1
MSAEFPAGPPSAAEQLSAAEHAERWHAAVATAYVPMAVEFLEDEPSRGTIAAHRLGPMRVLQVQAGPQAVTRTRRMIAGDDSAALILTLQQRGTSLKGQDGRESLIRPGAFSLTDASRTFRKRMGEDFVFTSFHFPRAALDVEERDLRALTATAFDPAAGSAALVATYLAGMAREASALDEAVGRRAAATVLDLLALLVDDRCGRDRPNGLRAAASLERVKDHIRRNLGDPDLSPSGIAEANHISLRFLHKLFQQEGTTVGAWTRTQRLDRCSRDLRRATVDELGVAGIARRWGFVNSSHFSRAFRAAYGMTPRDWQMLGRSQG